MGWTWRRSTSVGPLRFNFSTAGAGMSVGVKGARVSIGPRGTYVHVGAGGFRYSRRIDGPPPGARPSTPLPPSTASQPVAPERTVEVLEPVHLAVSTPDELVDEIRRKEQITGLTPVTLIAALLCLVLSLPMLAAQALHGLGWVLAAMGLLALICLPWAMWSDRKARLVRLHYVFDPLGENVHKGLERLLTAFERAHAIWAVIETGTAWVRRLTRRSPSTVIHLAPIAAVEVTCAVARHRKGRILTPLRALSILRRFRRHLDSPYTVIEVTPELLD